MDSKNKKPHSGPLHSLLRIGVVGSVVLILIYNFCIVKMASTNPYTSRVWAIYERSFIILSIPAMDSGIEEPDGSAIKGGSIF